MKRDEKDKRLFTAGIAEMGSVRGAIAAKPQVKSCSSMVIN
jgi:hypothetical protein